MIPLDQNDRNKQYKLEDDCSHCENRGYLEYPREDEEGTFVMKCIFNCIASQLYFTAIGNPKNPFNIRNCRSNPLS